MAHEAGAACTETGADSELLTTRATSGENQVAQVGAGDEKHEADRPQ